MFVVKYRDGATTFNKGNYVTLKKAECAGIVYKVLDNDGDEWHYRLWPAYGAFGAAFNRGNRTERCDDMVKVDLVHAGLEHLKMLNFIKNLTEHEEG